MEIQIVVFLFFVFVSAIFNTALIVCLYKAFAGVTAKMTETMSEFRKSSETRQLIDSLHVAAQRAASVTESTKVKMAEFGPVLERTEENYRRTLVVVDSKLEQFAEDVNTTAKKVRDVVSKPAFSVASFAAGVTKVLQTAEPEE